MTAQIHTLILAAGKGTRMKSELPKVVHPILGKPMVSYVIDAAKAVGSEKTIVITGFKSELVRHTLTNEQVEFVEQPQQLGTGHAVQCYARTSPSRPNHLMVVCGDTPLISQQTLKQMIELHLQQRPAITMMTLEMSDPGNYGRIIRRDGKVVAIREAKDCTKEELKITEVNLAVYLFDTDFLFSNIFKLNSKNSQNEFYLTDLVEMAEKQGLKVQAVIEKDESSTLGINSRQHLAQVGAILQSKILDYHMTRGVTIVNPAQTLIGPDCEIAPDTTIWPGCIITGRCRIDTNCEIGPNTVVFESDIGANSKIQCCIVEKATIPAGKTPAPYSKIVSGSSF